MCKIKTFCTINEWSDIVKMTYQCLMVHLYIMPYVRIIKTLVPCKWVVWHCKTRRHLSGTGALRKGIICRPLERSVNEPALRISKIPPFGRSDHRLMKNNVYSFKYLTFNFVVITFCRRVSLLIRLLSWIRTPTSHANFNRNSPTYVQL